MRGLFLCEELARLGLAVGEAAGDVRRILAWSHGLMTGEPMSHLGEPDQASAADLQGRKFPARNDPVNRSPA